MLITLVLMKSPQVAVAAPVVQRVAAPVAAPVGVAMVLQALGLGRGEALQTTPRSAIRSWNQAIPQM